MEIQRKTRIFKEGRTFNAHTLELDLASCAGTKHEAFKNLKQAVRLFLEEAEKMGTLLRILEEAGHGRRKARIDSPKFVWPESCEISPTPPPAPCATQPIPPPRYHSSDYKQIT